MAQKDEKVGSMEATKTISREERLKKLREAIQAEKVKPKIQRVPFMLRDNNNLDKYFEPRVVAVGPFHHDRKPKYKHAEKVKLKLAANFVKDSMQSDADLLKKVEDKIDELKKCYDKEATKDFGDELLAWMLFVDGCSTLEFIYKYDNLEDFQIKRDQEAFVEHDLFLLENQLPYQLLQLLMSSSQIREKLKKSIYDFVNRVAGAHQKAQNPEAEGQDVAIRMEAEPEPTHLLELLLTTMLGRSPNNKREKNKCTKLPHSFRNVQELQAAGIQFMPSNDNSLRSIYFISHLGRGILRLPQIKVDDSTNIDQKWLKYQITRTNIDILQCMS